MVKQMCADPNLNDFYGRVARIEKAHKKGYGFEARGTLGRSSSYKREKASWRLVKPLVLVMAMGLGLTLVLYGLGGFGLPLLLAGEFVAVAGVLAFIYVGFVATSVRDSWPESSFGSQYARPWSSLGRSRRSRYRRSRNPRFVLPARLKYSSPP